jgi:hypothetical protein
MSVLDSVHVFIGPTQSYFGKLFYFPGIFSCTFYPFLCSRMQIEHKLACYCHIKYLKLETRMKDVATISYVY